MVNRTRGIQDALRRSSWGGWDQSLLSGYQQSSSIVSGGYQTRISSGGKIQQKLPGLRRIPVSQPGPGPGPVGMSGEVLCCASLNKVKISEDEDLRPMKYGKASYASVPSLSLSPSYIFSKHHESSHGSSLRATTYESPSSCDISRNSHFTKVWVIPKSNLVNQ